MSDRLLRLQEEHKCCTVCDGVKLNCTVAEGGPSAWACGGWTRRFSLLLGDAQSFAGRCPCELGNGDTASLGLNRGHACADAVHVSGTPGLGKDSHVLL